MLDFDILEPLITSSTRTVTRQIHGVDWEDIRQEMYVWCVKHPRKLKEYLEHEDPKQGERLLAKSLINEGRRFAVKDRADRGGWKAHDNAYYSIAQLKEELLPSIFDPEAWIAGPQQGENNRGATPANERGTWLAQLADVAGAYRRLSGEQRLLLLMYHEQGHSLREVAEELGQEESAIERRFDTAVKRVLHLLGGEKPERCSRECECRGEPAGGRRVTSNAAARAMTDREVNGE